MMSEVKEKVKEKLYEWRRDRDLQGWVHPTWYRRCTPLQDRYCLISHEVKLFVKEKNCGWLVDEVTAADKQRLINRTWALPDIQRWTVWMEGEGTTCLMCDWVLDNYSYWELSNVSVPDELISLYVILLGKFKLVMLPFEYRQKRFSLPVRGVR